MTILERAWRVPWPNPGDLQAPIRILRIKLGEPWWIELAPDDHYGLRAPDPR
ncbi:hypothetical protein [Streptomyces kaniharaensis]|uniref:hypothetical protein n=1 Tax=Streptomyces kaniharaensis TaxID=212423 RepID=UPI001296F729|nr:hypothetical protein [Streptomyces kaniharaensis]